MADSKRYEDYGKPTLQQGGWERTGEGSDYIQYASPYNPNYDYRICTVDYIPQHHPFQISLTGIASKELEVSILELRSDNYIISSSSWQDNGYTFNLGSTYDKIGVMFRFKNGDTITPNDVTFDEVGAWLHSLRKLTTATEAIENPLYSDGTAITSYTIKGNTVQNGTPSPQSPVMPNGVGVRTENLFDVSQLSLRNGYAINDNGVEIESQYTGYTLNHISCEQETQYVLSYLVSSVNNGYYRVYFYDEDGNFISRTSSYIPTTMPFELHITTPPNTASFAIQYAYGGVTNNWNDLMINTGSTALPYEPYGYKIPITSGGVTTNINLGSTQTVRQIKKLVFDGTENWKFGAYPYLDLWRTIEPDYLREKINICYCSHLQTSTNIVNGESVVSNTCCFNIEDEACVLYYKDTSVSDLASFKSYLAAQYANGTPVTLWYVLATPETATVNEPLMKIGDYADTLSNAAQIPTTEGANSITVDTTVQPSEFTATWTGWHDASVREKSENLFDINDLEQGSIDSNNGSNIDTPDVQRTHSYISVSPITTYIISNINGAVRMHEYSDSGYIGSSIISSVFTTSDSCRKIRFNGLTGNFLQNTMLNTGSTALPYEPYWK